MSLEIILSLSVFFLLGFSVGIFFTFKKAKSERISSAERIEKLLQSEAAYKSKSEELQQRLAQQRQDFEAQSDAIFKKFESLSHKMLDENTERLRERSEKGLSLLLNPLKDRIVEFEKKVSEAYGQESRERFALKQEIQKIAEINLKMSTEASNLTNALKGNVKTQGNWGEIILEKILEASGLREGEEYVIQARDLNLKDENGNVLRPDAIVKLPDDKHIIIDSKVSLLSFERLCNNESEEIRGTLLKNFFISVDNHVKDLASKHYSRAIGLNSPDFVFLFMPMEAAFLTYAKENSSGFSQAWEKRVMIVGPSTLWPCLTTVSSLWKSERQNQNALKIAEYAGSLYDKFAGFTEDLEKIGKSLTGAQQSYDEAYSKLKSGKGNLIRQTERLRDLGAKTKRKLEVELEN